MRKIKNYKSIVSKETQESIIKDYVENFFSIRDLSIKYNIKSKSFISNVIGNKKRTLSEASKNAHRTKPERFKLNENAKSKIRAARLKYMKEHPEQTAWRQKNESFAEKCFTKILSDYNFDKQYLIYREYSVFPYFIDFAFYNEKIAIEVDGSQHLNPDRIERDKKKDELLLNNGWSIIHFTAVDVIKKPVFVVEKLQEIISSQKEKSIENGHIEYIGILKAPKTRQPIPKESNGRTAKQNEFAYKNRKVKNRPSKDELYNFLCEKSFTEVGRIYDVSDKTIIKWCKGYGIPSSRKEYDHITGKIRHYVKHEVICDNCGKHFYADAEKARFCSKKCSSEYNKKNPNKSLPIKRRHIFKITSDGILSKRVSENELVYYIDSGWSVGRRFDKTHKNS